jgi:nucleoside-diphosphate-sugar epimerase
VVPDVLERLNDRSAPQINMGYLGAERDFVYVTDVANAVAASLDRETPGYRVYNVSTGVATSIRTVVRLLQDAVGDTRPIHEQAARFRSFDRKSLVLDNSRLSRELGWRPAVGLKQGLHELVDV